MNTKLLKKVRDAMLAHPDQVYMDDWFSRRTGKKWSVGGCGTAGCIGGWGIFLASKKKTMVDAMDYGYHQPWFFDKQAKDAFKLTEPQAGLLFYSDSWPRRFRMRLHNADTPKRYANAVADRIDYFIKEKK